MSDEKKPAKKRDINWAAVLWYIHLHFLGLFAIWLAVTSAQWMTIFFTIFITTLGCLGVTVAAHRLWAHKAFEAVLLLRLFLVIAHSVAGVGPIYDWVLYHRLHHKYYGTDKDPYNHRKGFLYSHYTSNIYMPSVDYEQAKTEIDMRDIEDDLPVMIQKRFYWIFFAVFALLLPLNAPLEYWNESLATTILVTGVLRFAITTNVSWLVNSALLIWSSLDTKLAVDNLSIFIVTKSYWPAYHYLMPWDWKNSEFGRYNSGCSAFIVKMWYELGWIENMQTVTTEDMRKVIHQVVNKKLALKEGLEELKKLSKHNMQIQRKAIYN